MQKADISSLWQTPPDGLDLQSHQVDIWRIFLDLPADAVKSLESSLSVDESERAARFYFPAARDRYIVAHASLRRILARYLCCDPHQLSFSKNQYGKPSLISGEGMEFNLSHSGDYALVAVTRGHRVGVDVECIREDRELAHVARRYFSPREVSELLSLSADQRTVAFFNCWTRKEAYIKAHGLGLSLPLDSFDVSLMPAEPALLRETRPDPGEAARWILHSFEVDSGYASAVAVENAESDEAMEFRLWDWK